MTKDLAEMQTIMPYVMASKFTKALGNKLQTHKIFEKRAIEKTSGMTRLALGGRSSRAQSNTQIIRRTRRKKINPHL